MSFLQLIVHLFRFYTNSFQVNGFRDSFTIPRPFINAPEPAVVEFAIGVIIAFILAMIATLIGANLIGPVATAIGGALKNGNLTGAANSLTAQITLIFVTVVIVGVVSFLALFGGLAMKAQKEA